MYQQFSIKPQGRARQEKISSLIESMDVFNSSFRVIAGLPGQKRYMKNVLKIK